MLLVIHKSYFACFSRSRYENVVHYVCGRRKIICRVTIKVTCIFIKLSQWVFLNLETGITVKMTEGSSEHVKLLS